MNFNKFKIVDIDMRWRQRFTSYQKALPVLEEAVELAKLRPLSQLEKQGLIQAFEFTHELFWKTLKDFLEARGQKDIYGSRDAVRRGFKLGLLQNGEMWMQMIQSRNLSSHTYDEGVAETIFEMICQTYLTLFQKFRNTIQTKLE